LNLQLKITKDGSHTIYLPQLNEHYHSIHGAIQESQHVYINSGLTYTLQKNIPFINILEIGFGTGLNALLSCLKILNQTKIKINYTGLEAYPLPNKIVKELNYSRLITSSKETEFIFQMIHDAEWNKNIQITDNFSLHKIHNCIQNVNISGSHHIIYFDAFAPEKQPEMWLLEIFIKLYHQLYESGILVSYCAKGIIKRRLKEAGFEIETLNGPPGKREMVRAMVNSAPF
jgi:tRNA U34 5-methylaminomethyl-2-thiouridine-forming methyltransferase MnmC